MPAFTSRPMVRGIYLDGGLGTGAASSQPRLLLIGPSPSGETYVPKRISDLAVAEAEYGATAEIFKHLHLAWLQGARNFGVMRIGGKQGYVKIYDSSGGSLTIRPESGDATILDRYKLVLADGTISGVLRVMVYDTQSDAWVYDSEDVLVLDDGTIDVTNSNFPVMTIGDKDTVTQTWSFAAQTGAPTLGQLDNGTAGSGAGYEFTDALSSGKTVLQPVVVDGDDGTSMSQIELYAALEAGYQALDFRDADYVIPAGVYVDSPNIVDGDTVELYFGGPTAKSAGGSNDALGYLWQYEYQGKIYTYFVDSSTYFSSTKAAASLSMTTNSTLTATAKKAGIRGNNISVQVDATGAAGPTITYTKTDTSLAILITDDGSNTTLAAANAINSIPELATYVTMAGAATNLATEAAVSFSGGSGPAYISHAELTGDEEPAAVAARFALADTNNADVELREANFAHQLGTFCYFASTQWKSIIGAFTVLPPNGRSRADIAAWVGSAPSTTTADDGTQYIATVSDNGTGVLGNKFLVGKAATGAGYRANRVPNGNTTNSLLWGGLILTKGTSLPNGADFPYGVKDSDEAEDSGGKPIDLGKHLLPVVQYANLSTSYNGGTSYFGDCMAMVVGKLIVTTLPNEPFGPVNGIVRGTSVLPRVLAPQQNQLYKYGLIALEISSGGVVYIGKLRTAANQQQSDYTRVSTILAVNSVLDGIRDIGIQYQGKPFDYKTTSSLDQDVKSFLFDQINAQIINNGKVDLSWTAAGKLIGEIKARVLMIPPFAIETLVAELALTADETSF